MLASHVEPESIIHTMRNHGSLAAQRADAPLHGVASVIVEKNHPCSSAKRRALDMLQQHNFCQVQLLGIRLDVFLPMSSFYEAAKARRREVPIGNRRA